MTRGGPSFPALVAALLLIAGGLFGLLYGTMLNPISIGLIALGLLTPTALKMANQWERVVILRVGKLQSVRGPGLFVIIPVVDRAVAVIDTRIQTTDFNAERALTRDTVPVDVDAIVFWQVSDAAKAATEITDYRSAIARVSQTSLREMIGASALAELLSERKTADLRLKEDIGHKTVEWGVSVISVEIRDVGIPSALEDAMSREAQATREKQARVILASAEEAVAERFVAAARHLADNPAALQLRAMNLVYEMTKERGATILLPSSMVDSMNVGNILNLAGIAAANSDRPAAAYGAGTTTESPTRT
jgi:regulator of protease activity HflC (stomatin/prohibitin superfamily)